MTYRLRSALLGLTLIAGCATVARSALDERFGTPQPKENVAAPATVPIEYDRDVRPVLNNRCLVCHGCYDAPCQLKLDSYEGVLRGASATQIYHVERLTPSPLTRLFEDAQTTADWRAAGFYPVLNERQDSPDANLQAGVMARMLQLKQEHPLPAVKVLPATFDFSLSRSQQCPRIEDFDAFAAKYPQWGMPFGLPGLSPREHRTLTDWLAAGAPAAKPAELPESTAQEVARWETFFNGDGLKHRLAARYLYEHLFLAHLYLQDQGHQTVYFKLVRSRTPPGQPLSLISTRRPYDDPGVARVYYRLWRDPTSTIAKTHMPYQLTSARRDHWRQWFIDADYGVAALPGYDTPTASNPFRAFQLIPYQSRYAFLLDEAQFTIMNFIKGPVCRGNVALDVIQDRFWVFFATPQSAVSKEFSGFLADHTGELRLPAEAESGLWSIVHWRAYAKAQNAYLSAKGDFIRNNIATIDGASLNMYWDGGGTNRNAALTVFRHFDSATVVQGLVGERPQTAWLIDYPILERIHYLLVAGFDVYGTAGHQAMTRMYMDFLRMESEMNFLTYLPQPQRIAEVDQWYRGAQKDVQEYLDAYFEHEVLPAPIAYRTTEPKQELFGLLQQRLQPVLNHRYDPDQSGLSRNSISELAKIDRVRGVAASIMPQAAVVKIRDRGLLTVLSNSAYTNISSMFDEASRRLVAEDSLTVANGIVGAYPNVFFQMQEGDIAEFVGLVSALRTEADYSRLLDRFAMRRTDPGFWQLSDTVLADYARDEPLTSGILDYSRYDNR
ncbi:fatty acid cis/trans isomerase [Povalibacter sp.]|uniref:fatty acid cis/trans isomerase n=1 Tax=Povalibacter sp. TaxID=1962978 RepID=UPI002F41D060